MDQSEGLKYSPTVESFKSALRPRGERYRSDLTNLYTDHLEGYCDEIVRFDREFLEATGEYPRASTPYDIVNSPRPQDLEEIARGMMERHIYLEILNHPLVHENIQKKKKDGWSVVPPKRIEVLDAAIAAREAVTYEDYALSIADQNPIENSAQTMLGTGLLTHATNETVSWRIAGSSMSALNSAPLLAALGIAGSMGFTPIDGQWNDPKKAATMLQRSIELVMKDPFVLSHPNRDFIFERALELIGVTLKSSPKDAVLRVQTIFDSVPYFEGKKLLCRLYDPRAMPRMLDSVKALRDTFGDRVVIIAGKVTNARQYESLVDEGANAFDVGIGEGEICDTPGVTSATGNNLLTAYRIAQNGLDIPLICDGGTGRHVPIAIAIGASAVMKSKALSGGTIEQNPFGWTYIGRDGNRYKQYFGEASDAEKFAGGKIDPTGLDVMFSEGSVGKVEIDPRRLSAIKKLFLFQQSLATAAIFQHVGDLEELQRNPSPDLWRYTPLAAERASVHHK